MRNLKNDFGASEGSIAAAAEFWVGYRLELGGVGDSVTALPVIHIYCMVAYQKGNTAIS